MYLTCAWVGGVGGWVGGVRMWRVMMGGGFNLDQAASTPPTPHTHTCDMPMITAAPVVKPLTTLWLRKLVSHPSRSRPTAV